jgi:hypothetical protein
VLSLKKKQIKETNPPSYGRWIRCGEMAIVSYDADGAVIGMTLCIYIAGQLLP